MKKCTHCGCYNQDANIMCYDCGHTLAGAEKIDETELEAILEKASKYSDPFSFKPRHQIIFYADLLLIAASIVLVILSIIPDIIAYFAVFLFIFSAVSARFSEIIWKVNKFFLSFRIRSDNIEPSDWWFISREITIFGLFGCGILFLLLGFTYSG